MAQPQFAKSADNKLVITTPKEEVISYDELLERKAQIEQRIQSVRISRATELDNLKDNLQDVKRLIAQADKLGITPSPEPVEETEGQ